LERYEALRCLLGIGARVDGLLVLLAFRLLIVAHRFLALGGHHLGILRLRDLVGRVRIDEADDHVHEPHLTRFYRLVLPQQQFVRARIAAERDLDRFEALLDALGDADLAFARQQLDRAHFAHVHAHGVGGAAEFRIEVRERRGGLFDRFLIGGGGGIREQQRLGVRCLLVHRYAHVVDHVDDVFDLLRIDDLARQVIVDFRVREVALFLAASDQQLELRLALVGDLSGCSCWRFFDQVEAP
jgi:hypothetical protein